MVHNDVSRIISRSDIFYHEQQRDARISASNNNNNNGNSDRGHYPKENHALSDNCANRNCLDNARPKITRTINLTLPIYLLTINQPTYLATYASRLFELDINRYYIVYSSSRGEPRSLLPHFARCTSNATDLQLPSYSAEIVQSGDGLRGLEVAIV